MDVIAGRRRREQVLRVDHLLVALHFPDQSNLTQSCQCRIHDVLLSLHDPFAVDEDVLSQEPFLRRDDHLHGRLPDLLLLRAIDQ